MNNKLSRFIHSLMINSLLVSMMLLGSLLASAQVPTKINVVLDLTPFINSQRQLITKNKQIQENKIKQLDTVSPRTQGQPSVSSEPSKNISVPECNCDDTSDSYNYSNNFVYSSDKQKLYRVSPYCKCVVKPAAGYSGVAVNNILNPFSPNKSNGSWNIKY